MFGFLLFVSILLPAAQCEDLERFPNARYLGMGYNVITGSPDNNLLDPGFSFGVLQFTWKNGATTSDGKFLVPDYIQALQTKSCGFQSEASTVFGSRSYQQALSVDVSVDVGAEGLFWEFRFTASAGYRSVSQGASKFHRIYTSARAKCIQYQLSVNYLHASINVTSNFRQAVSSLPLTQDYRTYNAFINTYGTHFTSRVTMGAKMVIQSEFEESALTRMEEKGLSVEIGTKLSFMRFAAGISAETSLERQQRETYESMRRSYSASYLGTHPPSDGRWETWAESTTNSPYPVKYKLVPLTLLLTNKFFPDLSSDDLATKRNLLNAAYDTYCGNISECGTPAADRVPVRAKMTVSEFLGSTVVSCPPTYKLLSCGILNVRQSGPYNKGRCSFPVSDRSCECRDTAGAKCVLWCTNIDVKYMTATSAEVHGTTTVTCPSGYKVIGCHAEHKTGLEKWPTLYPLANGKQCRCYNYYGMTCIASCASNVRYHEVRHQYGTGVTTVTCSSGNFVLGCGIKPKGPPGGFEKWRTVAVKTLDSCECYDFFGATCYALCGQLI